MKVEDDDNDDDGGDKGGCGAEEFSLGFIPLFFLFNSKYIQLVLIFPNNNDDAKKKNCNKLFLCCSMFAALSFYVYVYTFSVYRINENRKK